jgi:hypothetical protein
MGAWVTYEAWMEDVHQRLKDEPIWENLVYRKALFTV